MLWIVVGVLILVMIVVIVPYIINGLLYLPIETNGTTDSDWLSFWGSFLGAIIGGIAGLLGVILTIKKIENDRRNDESAKFPCLIPIEQVIVLFQHKNIDQGTYISYDENMNIHEVRDIIGRRAGHSYEYAFINIINVGEEHAISVKSTWKSNDGDEFEDNRKVQIIRGASTNDLGNVNLPINIRYEIENILRRHYKEILENKLEELFKVGTLNITYKRRNGNRFNRSYSAYIKFFTKILHNLGEDNKIFFINISFDESL